MPRGWSAWKTWQRPTLPRLKTAVPSALTGVSRPSSEWDRVFRTACGHQPPGFEALETGSSCPIPTNPPHANRHGLMAVAQRGNGWWVQGLHGGAESGALPAAGWIGEVVTLAWVSQGPLSDGRGQRWCSSIGWRHHALTSDMTFCPLSFTRSGPRSSLSSD